MQVLLAGDRAFDQRHIHVLGELLGIHQRTPDQSTCSASVDQALVGIEQRHVAAGAAVQPYRGQPNLGLCVIAFPPASG